MFLLQLVYPFLKCQKVENTQNYNTLNIKLSTMNKKQVTGRAYFAPHIEVYTVKFESPFLAGSTEGGHKDAENDETLNAKQFLFDEEDNF